MSEADKNYKDTKTQHFRRSFSGGAKKMDKFVVLKDHNACAKASA